MKITKKEKRGILALVELNKLLGKKEIYKTFTIAKLEICFSWRSSKNLCGRFGGGWNWKFGFQCGGRTLILSLLIFDLRFTFKEPTDDR